VGDPRSFAYAGERGFGLLAVAWVNNLAQLADLVRCYREAIVSGGISPDVGQVCTHYQVVVGAESAQARSLAETALRSYVSSLTSARSQAQDAQLQAVASSSTGIEIDEVVAQGRVLAGTPEEVVDQLEVATAELGLDAVDCNFFFGGIPFELAERSFRLFGERVIPRLR
jgi:alkanesulfonate monooxygenase SsuD/methylene tetrahydromethanopterin reductase-like flavin-dependent oxidoreductase (luciferase family)